MQELQPNFLAHTMTRQQFEVGIQRLYYVAWAGFSLFYLGAALVETEVLPTSTNDIGIAIGFVLLVLVIPAVLMHLVRWIYRGFVPE